MAITDEQHAAQAALAGLQTRAAGGEHVAQSANHIAFRASPFKYAISEFGRSICRLIRFVSSPRWRTPGTVPECGRI